MECEVIWSTGDDPGLEHVHVAEHENGISADGVMIRHYQGQTTRVYYTIRCDAGWRMQEVRVSVLAPNGPHLHLLATGDGRWREAAGHARHNLDGCSDVDIWGSGFTNTLPIRRLSLQPGESAELDVAYVSLPSTEVGRVCQRYTCLASDEAGARYRYESLETGFTAELSVGEHGLVIDYPGVAHRVWASTR